MGRAELLATGAVMAVLLPGCGGGGGRRSTTEVARSGLIVPQRGIGRLSLGMTPAQVRHRYGRPSRVVHASESETGKPILDWSYGTRGLTAELRHVKDSRFSLAGISTRSRRYRTASGAGVGTNERDLRSRVAGLDCGPTDPGQRWCTLGEGAVGTPQTVFVLRRGEVSEVRVLIAFP